MVLNRCLSEANGFIYTIVQPTVAIASPYCEPDEDPLIPPVIGTKMYISVEELYSEKEIRTVGKREGSLLLTGRAVSPMLVPPIFLQDQRYFISFEYSLGLQFSDHECFLRKLPRGRFSLERTFGDYLEIEVFNKPGVSFGR